MPHPLAPYGWDDRVAATFSRLGHDDYLPGRVCRVDRQSCLVATPTGTIRVSSYGAAPSGAGPGAIPVTGDWVALADTGAGESGSAGWGLVAVLPRWSVVARRDAEDRVTASQVLVANVDVLALVSALDRPVVPNRIERMLAVAWESGAVPVLVLTKADAAADLAGAVGAARSAAGAVLVQPTSTLSGVGIEELRALIRPARTMALIGPSGAGKSSLVNALAGDDIQSTGAVRDHDHRGRHTTTSRSLIPLATGGVLIDTPGLRGLALWDASAGVAATFTDLDDLAADCRFDDCRHRSEPGCAVLAATASGVLDRRRLVSYHTLQDELAALEARQVELARRPAGRRLGERARRVAARKLPRRRRS